MHTRGLIAVGLSAAAGCALFFLLFAAVFNGLWSLLVVCFLMYPGVAAIAVGLGKVRPGVIAVALTSPAWPWVLWLVASSVPEAGLLRASLWPGAVGTLFGLTWLAGWLVRRRNVR